MPSASMLPRTPGDRDRAGSRRPASRPAAWLFVAALAATSASPALAQDDGAKEAAAPDVKSEPRPVRVVPVELDDLVETVAVIGDLEGMNEIQVGPEVAARIRQIAVDEGERVRKGTVLATLVGDVQRQSMRQAEASLEAALSQRDAALDNLRRMKALAEVGSIPPAQLESAETQARSAEAQVEQARAGIGQATTQTDRTVIKSPLTGVVSNLTARAGDLATPGVPLMTIVERDRLKVVLRVPERFFLQVERGMPVTVTPLAREDRAVEAAVTLVGPVVDRRTRTGLVEIHLSNREGRLVPGSAVRANIELSRQADVPMVPANAVLLRTETLQTGEAHVFLAREGKAERREVRLGERQGDRLQIIEGLSAGDPLIVRGAHLLRDGEPVEIRNQTQQAEAR